MWAGAGEQRWAMTAKGGDKAGNGYGWGMTMWAGRVGRLSIGDASPCLHWISTRIVVVHVVVIVVNSNGSDITFE